jgi:hypothetical protein
MTGSEEAMSVLEPLNRQVSRLGFVDVKLLTIAAFVAGLLAAKLFPAVVMADSGWYVFLAVACASHPMLLLLMRTVSGATSGEDSKY